MCALALFLYALDDARGWLVSWIAARNAVIATGLSVWALYFHIRARTGTPPVRLASRRWCSALALLAGEGAIVDLRLLVRLRALARSRDGARTRSLMPYAIDGRASWRFAYRALDYGVSHSGLYFDPLREPLAFIGALLERGPVLLFAQSGGAVVGRVQRRCSRSRCCSAW